MSETKKVSMERFNEVASKPKRGRQGQWSKVIADIAKDKQPREVSGITKGSVAAGVRAAKEAGMRYAYSAPTKKDETTGYIIIAPPEKTEKEPTKEAEKKKAS